jgi:cytochrome c-type biogenesis protein CcmH
LLAAVLVVAVLALMLPPMIRQRHAAAPDRNEINLAIVREQLAEVESRLERGEIGDQEWRDERQRLERDLAIALQTEGKTRDSGQWLIWPLAAAVPIAAGALYITLGTPTALQSTAPAVVATESGAPQTPDMRVVIQRIRERVAEQPEDAEAWFMLGRAYMNVREFDNAVAAMRRSLEVEPDNIDVMVRLADALAMVRNGQMQGEPTDLLKKVIQVAPQHPQALWLLGMAQRDEGDLSGAISSWQKLLGLLDSDPRSQQEVQQLIAQAQEALGATPASPATPAAVAGPTLEVTVQAGVELDAAIDPGTTVFVYARAMQGPPMPLAVARRTVADLPFTVTLSEADAMVAGMGIGSAGQLVVGARIALSGQAIAQSGDIMGEVDGVDPQQSPAVSVLLGDIVP